MNNIFLRESKMLDYNSPAICSLVREKGWDNLDDFNKIKEIYNFVRDEIKFGYNVDDSIPASKVLKDGYGVAVSDFHNPVIDWNANNTYIQSVGINQDFGVYNSPDELLAEHHQEMSFVKKILFRCVGRHLMNRNVNSIRKG